MLRPTRADIDPTAITDNVAALVGLASPAGLCAVVKADGYGHGAVVAARAALDGGADRLAVALVEEALELREAGIGAPILVLSQPPPPAVAVAVEAGVSFCVDTDAGVDAAAGAGSTASPARVHLKINTGMNRVGAPPAVAVDLATRIDRTPHLIMEGVWTHLSVADEVDDPETDAQIDRFEEVLGHLRDAGLDPGIAHVANSAGLLAHPRARFDLVRCGIAIYGIAPMPAPAPPIRPALSLISEVSHVARLAPGDAVSYGRRWTAPRSTTIATVPIGYADGVRRDAGRSGAMVLIGGHRLPIVGNVTMDQLMVDVGDRDVAVGDEVVLIGSQGGESITAGDWADWLDTIGYEIVCAIGPRVPRRVTT